ncbi:MAG: LapA family protein [Anaerolineales bacterium]
MQILLIFSFIIAFVAIIFAIQNTAITPIRFLIWETEGSLALILFIALVAGALISYLATAPGQIKARMAISNQRKRITEVEGQLSSTQEDLGQVQGQLDVIEAQKEAELAPASDESTATGDPGDDSET